MLLTTQNIASVVGASVLQADFIEWVANQAQVDNDTFTIYDGKRATIGDVTYTLLSNGSVRGRCPVIGLFMARTVH